MSYLPHRLNTWDAVGTLKSTFEQIILDMVDFYGEFDGAQRSHARWIAGTGKPLDKKLCFPTLFYSVHLGREAILS